jgi:hypothetical protein
MVKSLSQVTVFDIFCEKNASLTVAVCYWVAEVCRRCALDGYEVAEVCPR